MFTNPITLPQEILDRIERVLDYHHSSKLTATPSVAEEGLEPAHKPYEFLVLEMLPKISLPSGLSDLSGATLSVMRDGLGAIPTAQLTPPQDLKTLASWLHFANGIASKRRTVMQTVFTRTCYSDGDAFPCETYVIAFAIEGLEPGLYHYSPRDFALRKMRDGPELTLARLTRGRPDLIFLKTVPAAMLVSTIFSRSTWRFGRRGYRHALQDAGYMVQNLLTAATGLGIQTMARLHLNDSANAQLIGVPADADYGQAEAVQSMVVWADRANCPMETTPAGSASRVSVPQRAMEPIPRSLVSDEVVPYVSILEAHAACVAPGVALREVRPPLTDLSPLPVGQLSFELPVSMSALPPGELLRKAMIARQPAHDFAARAVQRGAFVAINELSFRGGTYFPLHPDGPHVALVRPFWIIHSVAAMDPGVWYYNPVTDQWSILRHGIFRNESAQMALGQAKFGSAAAVCILACSFAHVMSLVGPDLYRLAHLESGMVTNRIALACEGLGLGWRQTGSFLDDEVRQFLGLQQTGWEILSLIGIGAHLRAAAAAQPTGE